MREFIRRVLDEERLFTLGMGACLTAVVLVVYWFVSFVTSLAGFALGVVLILVFICGVMLVAHEVDRAKDRPLEGARQAEAYL